MQEQEGMNLKILLPSRVFAEVAGVLRIVAETSQGSFGILPRRLDFVAALTPGILTYETREEGEAFAALDEGVLVKTGQDVKISVRSAVGGKHLSDLRKAVEDEFLGLDEQDQLVRSAMSKMEGNLIHRLKELHDE